MRILLLNFCYCGSKIGISLNLQQNHSSFCDTINMCTTICLHLAPSFPESLCVMRRRKAPSFISKTNMPWEHGCVFNCSMEIELPSLTRVLQVTKKRKKIWAKKEKKTKKKLRLHWNYHRSTPLVNSYNIIPSTVTRKKKRVPQERSSM